MNGWPAVSPPGGFQWNAVGSNTLGAASSAADFEWILEGFWEAKMVEKLRFSMFFGACFGRFRFFDESDNEKTHGIFIVFNMFDPIFKKWKISK